MRKLTLVRSYIQNMRPWVVSIQVRIHIVVVVGVGVFDDLKVDDELWVKGEEFAMDASS